MVNKTQKLILETIEVFLQLQLKSVRDMLEEEDIEKIKSRQPGRRRLSLVDYVVTILTNERRALHVNEMVDLVRERFKRSTDRDTISSALAKKARQGILVRQTGPATFALIDHETPSGGSL